MKVALDLFCSKDFISCMMLLDVIETNITIRIVFATQDFNVVELILIRVTDP